MGVEYAAALAGFGLAGYWIDRHYGSGPWGVVIGAALGLIGGTYNLIRQSTAAFRQFDQDATQPREKDAKQPREKDAAHPFEKDAKTPPENDSQDGVP